MSQFLTVSLNEVVCASDSDSEPESELSAAILRGMEAFRCSESPYHERFLKGKAVEGCRHNASQTYLMINESEVDACLGGQNDHSDVVAAFFTVRISSLSLEQEFVSKSRKKKVSAHLFARDKTIGCYVIGELCRSSNLTCDELPGKAILDQCIAVISNSQKLVGGRLVLVDSRRRLLDTLYGPYGFSELMMAGSQTEDGEPLITSFLSL